MASTCIELEPACAKLDKVLAIYYKSMGKLDQYFPNGSNGDSIFAIWVDENGFDDDGLEDELNDAPKNASIIEFHVDDENKLFPLNKTINDDNKRDTEIFNIIKYCNSKGKPPASNALSIIDLELDVKEDEMKETAKLFKEQMPGIAATVSKEPDVMHFFSMSKQNNSFPVLPTIVDCFTRDRIEAKLLENEPPGADEWAKQHLTNHLDKTSKQKIGKAINGYCNRISPLFQYSAITAIDDSVADIANYIAAVSQLIKNSIENGTTKPPFQVDLSIAVKGVQETATMEGVDGSDGDDDDDDPTPHNPETKAKTQIIGNIHDKLDHEKCGYVQKPLDNTERLGKERVLATHFDDFKKKLKQTNAAGYDNKTFPQRRRFVIFADRRKEKDVITFLDPPSSCNQMPNGHVPLWYFESVRKCIIPRKGFGDGSKEQENKATEEKEPQNVTINAETAAGGQLITFSFHVESADQIKCYLFWNNQSMRFYPQDIAETFRFVFNAKRFNEFTKDDETVKQIINRMYIKDEQYEVFYESLCKANNKTCDFPRAKYSK